MGTWGLLALQDDQASDLLERLTAGGDTRLLAEALSSVEDAGSAYLEAPEAQSALAACEVVAWLLGRRGSAQGIEPRFIDWCSAHPKALSSELAARGAAVIDRVLDQDSELRELWEEGAEGPQWVAGVRELRNRLLLAKGQQ
jgi:hypothetical protein